MKQQRAWLAWAACVLVASPALAVDRAACVEASSKAQDLRAASKLVEAREQILVCASSDCPAVVARDCSQWLIEVDQATPSVTLAVRTGDGRDLVAVKVTLDDAPWLQVLDGRAHALDPGPHKLRFEAEGFPTTTQDVVIREGDKDRQISVTLGSAPVPVKVEPVLPVRVEPATPVARTRSTWMRPFGITSLVLGGVTLAVGGVLAGVAASQWGQATKTCPIADPCADPKAQDQRSTAATLADWSTALLIGGGVVAAAGLVFVIASPKSAETAHVSLLPTSGGLAFSLGGAF